VLLRASRVLEHGREAPAVRRMDTWWALPDGLPQHRGEEPHT